MSTPTETTEPLAAPPIDDDAKSNITVAGSSVAATEAEEDAASYSMSIKSAASNNNNNNNSKTKTSEITGDKFILTKDASLEISINNAPVDVSQLITNEEEEEEEDKSGDNGTDAAPMHFHVLRTPARLRGTPSSGGSVTGTTSTSGLRSRSSSRSRPGSRRNSVSPIRSTTGTASPCGGDAGSTTSSLADMTDYLHKDNFVNPDILLDKLGFRDLDPKLSQAELQEMLSKHLSSNSSLPTLNERMSEEMMEDVHAFTDLVFVKKTETGGKKKKKKSLSGGSSPVSNEAKEEENEEEEEDDEDEEEEEKRPTRGTLITLDEAVEEEDEEDDEDDDNEGQISPTSSISGDDNDQEGDNGEQDDDDKFGQAEIELPTSTMAELEVANMDRAELLKRNRLSTMAVAGNGRDFLDDDEKGR